MGVLNELYHVTKFEYVKKSDVSYVSENAFDGTASVVLLAGGAWSEIKFTPGTATIGEKRITTEDSGPYFKQQFSGSIPAKDAGYPQALREYTEEPVVCRLTMSNGKVLIVGDNMSVVRLEYDLSSDGHDVEVKFERESVGGLAEEEV